MTNPELISQWLPFTEEEIRFAFTTNGLPPEMAEKAAHALAEAARGATPESGIGFTELEGFLAPIAQLSPDAARRVAEFHARFGK
ncbi:MAG TPA: hypothetical protein VGC44_15465 [Longimicrobiales bacterium]